MNEELLTRLRKELEEERATLLGQLEEYGADPYTGKVRAIAGIDDNFADSGAATAERGETFALIEQAQNRLAAVDEALARMGRGVYGECVDCGGQIPEARLEARPLSVRCVACAGKRT